MLHLESISQMKRVQRYMPDVARAVLDSISLHLWYITAPSIPLALVDESVSIDEKSKLAIKLLGFTRPEKFPLGKPSFPDLSSFSDRKWVSGKIPDLSTMMGPESWLIFSKLGMDDKDMEWLEHSPEKWEDFEGFRRFRDFVKKLTITNDPAERGVGLVKEFISTFQNETSCQNNLLAVSKHRSLVQKNSNKDTLAKIGLN